MPSIGLGTWTSPPDEIDKAVTTALEVGYRLIDGAYVYKNEKQVGEALEKCMNKMNLNREDIFITSKLWSTFMRPELVKVACKNTLKDLHLNYVDLYLIHWPVAFQPGGADFPKGDDGYILYDNVPLEDTWREMERLVDEGLVKSIGLSNFNRKQIDRILKCCRIKPVNLQVEIHANFPNSNLVDYAKSVGMTVTAYAPLGSPGASPGSVNLLTAPWVETIAKKHNKTSAQVLLRYLIQRGIAVVPKSVTPGRIKENFDIFNFQLTEDEMEVLHTKGTHERQFKLLGMSKSPEYPFNDEY